MTGNQVPASGPGHQIAVDRKPFPTAFIALCCLLVSAATTQLWHAFSWGQDSWQLSEWLINYAGGFVRRGMTGALIQAVSSHTGIQANHVAILTGLACYLALLLWFLRNAVGTFPGALLLSCLVMGFPAYQDSIIRKDCLEILLLLGCVRLDASRLPRILACCAVNILAGFAILCHEGFVFYSLGPLVLLSFRHGTRLTIPAAVRRCLALLPAAACFLVAVTHHGSPLIARAVNHSWIPLWRAIEPGIPHPDQPAAAIQALGWTTREGLDPAINLWTSGIYQPAVWISLFAAAFLLLVLFTDRNSDRPGAPAMDVRIRFAALLLSQLAFISPLFLLGYDYGRWMFLWAATSLMLHSSGMEAPRWLQSAMARFTHRIKLRGLISRIPPRDWYLLFFGVPVCWNIHSFLEASPVARHLKILWLHL